MNSGFPETVPSESPSEVSIRHSWAHFDPQAQRNEAFENSISANAVRLNGSNLVVDLSRLSQVVSSPANRGFNPAAQATLTSFMHPVRSALLSQHSPGKQTASGSSSPAPAADTLPSTSALQATATMGSNTEPQSKNGGRSRKLRTEPKLLEQPESPSQSKPRGTTLKLKIPPKAAVPAVFSSSSTLVPAPAPSQAHKKAPSKKATLKKATSKIAASSSSATVPVNGDQPPTTNTAMVVDNVSNLLPSPDASTSSESTQPLLVSESVSAPVPSRKTSRQQKPSERARLALAMSEVTDKGTYCSEFQSDDDSILLGPSKQASGKKRQRDEKAEDESDPLGPSARKQPRTVKASPSDSSATLVESSPSKKTPRPRKLGDSANIFFDVDFSFISDTDNSESQAQWKQLIDVWLTFEHVFDSPGSQYNAPVNVNNTLPRSEHRPQCIAQWCKRARAQNWRAHRAGPTGIDAKTINDIQTLLKWLDKMDTDFSSWWNELKEAHEKKSDINASPALLCPGINGLLNVVASLFFWAEGIQDFESHTADDTSERSVQEFDKTKKGWFEAVQDVRGVVEGMLAAMKKT